MTKAYIDGDLIAYKCCAVTQELVYSHLDIKSSCGEYPLFGFPNKTDAKGYCDENDIDVDGIFQDVRNPKFEIAASTAFEMTQNIIDGMVTEFSVNIEPVLCFSHFRNWRKEFNLPFEYKGNRKNTPRPPALEFVKYKLSDAYKTLVVPFYEADDLMGIMGTESNNAIIATLDKDLNQIPHTPIWNWEKKTTSQMSDEDAFKHLMMQVLTGDTSDGIPGIPKMGPKKAEKVLEGVDANGWVNAVYNQYFNSLPDKDGTPVSTHYNGNLRALWICREFGDYKSIPHAVLE